MCLVPGSGSTAHAEDIKGKARDRHHAKECHVHEAVAQRSDVPILLPFILCDHALGVVDAAWVGRVLRVVVKAQVGEARWPLPHLVERVVDLLFAPDEAQVGLICVLACTGGLRF